MRPTENGLAVSQLQPPGTLNPKTPAVDWRSAMRRRTIVVDSPLAFRMRRVEAARAGDIGIEILTMPLLAARLAGGFCRLADRELLAPAIAAALESGGFKEISEVQSLPGMVRAVTQTLDRIWD